MHPKSKDNTTATAVAIAVTHGNWCHWEENRLLWKLTSLQKGLAAVVARQHGRRFQP